MQVVDYIWPKEQKKHLGHNRAHVEAGQTVYAIQHETGLYFYYAYTEAGIAEEVCRKMNADRPNLEANFKRAPGVVTARTSL